MRRILLLFLFLNVTWICNAQCPTDDVWLISQQDVDNWAVFFPNCTNFEFVIIVDNQAGNIENLNGLSNLTFIKSLWINFTNITDMSDLPNLERVGSLDINDNDQLTSLAGLSSLVAVREELIFTANDNLLNLNGLEGLVDDNGLDVNIGIVNNPLLSDISAIENIPSNKIRNLSIINNPSLSFCSVQNICDYLENNGTHLIDNNAVGCNNKTEVLDQCLLNGPSFIPESTITITPNPSRSQINILLAEMLKQRWIRIFSATGTLLLETGDTVIDATSLSAGIYFIMIETDHGTFSRKFVKE